MKKWSGPNTTMGRLNNMQEVLWEERRRNPTPVGACDGCMRRFRGFPAEEEMFDEDEEPGPDAGDAFKHCTQCDWTVCEDCMHPGNQGAPVPSDLSRLHD